MPVVRRILGPMPLARLSSTHALATAGDAFFTVSLAGSLFFNVSIGAARPRVIAYLAITLAPFVVLAPLVGPLIDRFGRARRLVAASTCLGRGIVCLLVAGDIRNLLLYPEAFGVLVLEKAYSVTKSALVPSLVGADADLVSANSRLARISTVAGLASGSLAAVLLHFSDATPVLRLASFAYFAAAGLALRIPSDDVVRLPPELESHERQSPKLRFAAGAMAVLRATIGFVVFLVAFGLKRAGDPTWFFGVVAAASIAGGFAGNVASPLLRRRMRHVEPLLAIALAVAALISLAAAIHVGRPSVTAAVFGNACAASVGLSLINITEPTRHQSIS
jgi:MFS family permease